MQKKLKQNDQVQKNRHILQSLIMCIKFCGAIELALRGHDEKQSSDNPGIYVGLIKFANFVPLLADETTDTSNYQ